MLTQMIICIVLIVVIFLGLINHIMEKSISSTRVHHTFLGWSETVSHLIFYSYLQVQTNYVYVKHFNFN
jgi:hypothetical protein